MEENRQQPGQAPQQFDTGRTEVILEPIEDLGLPKKPKGSGSFAKKRKKRRQQRRILILLGVIGAVALSILIYIFVSSQQRSAAEAAAQIAAEEALRAEQEQQQKEFEQMANSTVFLEGITVNGIAIGGMTMDEAKAALATAEANISAQRELQLVYDNKLFPLDLSNMPSTVNTDSVLTEAYSLGKTGDYTAMKAETDDIKTNGRAFTLTVSYDMTMLTTGIAQIASQIDVAPVNASVSGIDKDTHTLTIKSETVGHAVDQAALLTLITDAILNGVKTPINIPVVETQPTVTKSALQGQYVMRASMTTDFSSSPSARKYNVKKGAGIINGTVLSPGETFSTNDTLGVRSAANGWKEANAYESGAVVPQYGGGVCQLSTTLYNAVVKADLEIVFRRNHSMPVTYIDKGLDATINSVGNEIDFKFKNNTAGEIIVIGYTTSSSKLTFEIWGLPFATSEYDEIKLTSAQVSSNTIDGDPVEIEVPVGAEKADGSLMVAGETYIAVAARKGYVYQSYKNYYKAGTLVKKEKLAVSTYKAYQGEIWICPADETPTPVVTSTPSAVVWDTPTPVPTAEPTPTPTTVYVDPSTPEVT
ncbi:MAG: VanW family protein [Eubacteriales bacterium]|nr:VanW family protein [Eubacteriales bacterium]